MMGEKSLDNKEEKSVAYLLAYLDIIDDAIVGLTSDFRISYWSKGAERELGYSSDEIMNKSLEIIIPEDKLDEYESKISEVKKGNRVNNLETKRIHKDGTIVDLSISLSPIFDINGNQIGVLGIYKDISEKIELSKKLQEYEGKSRLALEGGQFGIWDYDLKEEILLHYNNFKGFLGYNEDELVDTSESWTNLIHPEDQSIVLSKFNNYYKNNEYIVEYRIKCKDGKYKWIRSKGKVSHWSDDGKPLRMVGTNEDITDRKAIKQQLKENIQELNELKQQAEGANKAKSQFLANIAHGIRTPLNGIQGLIQLIELSNDKVEQNRYIDMLKESTLTLESIINDILDLEKEEIQFVVRDSGIGIQEDIKNKLFHNFIQGNVSSKKKHVGSGLGLAISKRLADLMDAEIWFDSTFGEGSMFYFKCKFKNPTPSLIKAEKIESINKKNEKNNISANEITILCVEDNFINQEVLGGLIKRKGYNYLPAYNGKEAINILKANKVNLIIMDIQLPEQNGFETTKIIRGDDDLKHIPIIAITAYALHEDRDKCIKAGMDDYISKPIDINKFNKLLEHYLG